MKRPSDLAHKGRPVEEWVDLHFFRPIGIRIARTLVPTRISADQVTVWSILIGLVAGHLFVYTSRWINAVGLLLFLVSEVFDSADGQLARLRGTSTRVGRTLDGIGDNLRFINLYLHLIIRLVLTGAGWYGVLLGAVAGLSHSLQSAAVDFVRNAFLWIGSGGGELDLPEDVEPVRHGAAWEGARFRARVYRDYVVRQAQLFPRSLQLLRALRQVQPTEAFRAEYRERQQVLLPLCSWLGQNIRFALVGVAVLAGRPSAYLWAEVGVMNLLLVVLLLVHESNATALGQFLESDPHAYARTG